MLFRFREAEALGLIDELKKLRQRVKEERRDEIDGSFNWHFTGIGF